MAISEVPPPLASVPASVWSWIPQLTRPPDSSEGTWLRYGGGPLAATLKSPQLS